MPATPPSDAPETTNDPTASHPAGSPLVATPTYNSDAQSLLDNLQLGGPAGGPVIAPPPALPEYDLLGELGRGGMGVVFKARHRTLNRVVALKMIRSAEGVSAAEVIRFLAEAEAVAAIKHP